MATPVKRQPHRPPPPPTTPRRLSQNSDPNLSTPRRNAPFIRPPKTPRTANFLDTKKKPQPSSTKSNGGGCKSLFLHSNNSPQPSRGECKESAKTAPPPSILHPKSLSMDRTPTPTPRKPNQSGQTKFLDSNNSPKPSKGERGESGNTIFLDSNNSPKPSNEGECGESGKTKFLDFNNSPQVSRRTPRKGGEGSPCSGGSSGSRSYKVRKMKRMMLEEARSNIPETGVGRVMHLVHAFERLLTLPKGSQVNHGREVMHLALPESEGSENAVEIEGFAYSIDGSDDRLSLGSSYSEGGGRRSSRGDSTESSERGWRRKKMKVTSQQPFKLRTEQRGRKKEERFLNKMKEMLQEEEKYRVPIAQSLPLTTDHPECLAKPNVKESTEPIDLVLHSDVRALERAEFDQQNAQRLTFYEQTKLEREVQQKLEEEEETRRLRRELVHKAQPMPHFDRPFVPKKSTRPGTVPKEPRFHIRQ